MNADLQNNRWVSRPRLPLSGCWALFFKRRQGPVPAPAANRHFCRGCLRTKKSRDRSPGS